MVKIDVLGVVVLEKSGGKGGAAGHDGGAKGHTAHVKDAHKNDYEGQIEELKARAADYKETLQRLQAEFENAGKRLEREKDEFRKFVGAKSVEGFLPLVDSVEEGIKQAAKSGNEEMRKGFEALKAQFAGALDANGVKQIETIGRKFDHALHEALMTGNEGAKGDEEILEEFRKGYTINGRILRPAKVKVNRKE